MRLLWSFLFALAAIASVALFLVGPLKLNSEYWFLDNIAQLGASVDNLFLIILGLTGAVFVGYMIFFVYATYQFADRPERQGKAWYSHGNLKLEAIWTAIPAVILFFLAIYQMNAWADIKFESRQPDVPVLAEITGRQFQWKVRYPGPDQKFHTPDDLQVVNDFHMVKDEPTVIRLTAEDVLHAFFVPAMRIKQDAVPGLAIPVWFDADTAGVHELVCAELCGWGHYKMRATITVHESRSDFEDWLAEASRKQAEDGYNGSEEPGSEQQPSETTAEPTNQVAMTSKNRAN